MKDAYLYPAYTLQERAGKPGGGKGALIQINKTGSLQTHCGNDRCVFQPIGVDMYNQTLTGDKSKTMSSRATDSDHVPCVIESYAFEPGITKRDGGDSRITKNVTPTLRSNMGDNQTAVCYVANSSGNDIGGTVDAHYYKGQGEREGTEREFIVCKKQCVTQKSDSSNGTKMISQ